MKRPSNLFSHLLRSWWSSSAKLALPGALAITMGLSSQAHAADYEGMLVNQNTKLSLCGELNYKRQERNCADPNVTDVKRCLDLNRRDPLFTYQQEKQYNCVNTGYSHGVGIITEVIEDSEKQGGCLAKNVLQFYDDILANNRFQNLSRQWQESLELPLNLDVGIDTKDSIFNIQINLSDSDIQGNNKMFVPLSVSSFNEKGKCQNLSIAEVLTKVTNELSRLSIIKSQSSIDYIGADPATNHDIEVFDADRFEARPVIEGNAAKEVDFSSANR